MLCHFAAVCRDLGPRVGELRVDVDNAQNLERVPGTEIYKVEGRYVKLTLGTARYWDNAAQEHVEVSDAPKFDGVLFVVDDIHVHGEGDVSYSMRLVPADDSVDLTVYGDFNYSLNSDESSWEYEDIPKIVPSGLVEGILVDNFHFFSSDISPHIPDEIKKEIVKIPFLVSYEKE